MLKVLGLGDNIVDRYVHKKMLFPGGNAYNFAIFSKLLGADSSYMGVFGNDENTMLLQKPLNHFHIDYAKCQYAEAENGYTEVELIHGDRVISEGNRGGATRTAPLIIEDEDIRYIRGFDLVHSSCYSFLEDQLKKIAHAGPELSFDFSDCFEEAYLEKICPILSFGFFSCGHLDLEKTKELLIKSCRFGCRISVATLGKKGALVYNKGKFYEKASYGLTVPVVDTMGAGDSFITAFLLEYMAGLRQIEHERDNGNDIFEKSAKEDFIDRLTAYSMACGHLFAAKNCRIEGTFGFGSSY